MYEDEIPVGKAKDLRGQKFSALTVLYRVANAGKQTRWKCLCDCGNTTIVFASNLLKGNHTTSCGCKKFSSYGEDLTGIVFGKLTALEKSDKTCITGAMWKCKCECGDTVIVSRNHLTTGHTKSCGCFKKDQISLANSAKISDGTRFGKLTVIKEAYKRNLQTYWKCKCDCGSITCVPTAKLNSGHTQSCGCLASKGELKAINILREKNAICLVHHTFENCRFPWSGHLAEFDIYLPNLNILIEIDGIQHYQSVNHFGGEEEFQIRKKRDAYKNQWCRENGIPLIRIPYWKLDTLCIEDLMLETTQFRVV